MMLERLLFIVGVMVVLAATLLTCTERADAWLPVGEPVEVHA